MHGPNGACGECVQGRDKLNDRLGLVNSTQVTIWNI